MEITVLQQFMWDLEGGVKLWVQQHQPKSVQEALKQEEDFLVAGCEHIPELGITHPGPKKVRVSSPHSKAVAELLSMGLGSLCFQCR